MRHILRGLLLLVVALGLIVSGTALAQDDPIAQKQECEAQGGTFFVNPSGSFCEVDGVTNVLSCAYGDPADCEDPKAETGPSPESEKELSRLEAEADLSRRLAERMWDTVDRMDGEGGGPETPWPTVEETVWQSLGGDAEKNAQSWKQLGELIAAAFRDSFM